MSAERDSLTEKIIGLAIEVHRRLGPGLLESAYEECLCWELKQSGLRADREVALPVTYKQVRLDLGYRLDFGGGEAGHHRAEDGGKTFAYS